MSNELIPAVPGGEFILYQTEDGRTKLEVRFKNETVWFSLNQMADLFQRDKSVISRHIKNVFEEGELVRGSVVAESATTEADGKTYLTLNERAILDHAGKISHQMAVELAEGEYEKFNRQRIQESDRAGGDFDAAIKKLPPPPKRKKGDKQ